MAVIQGFDPRTGKPAGDPVAETTDAALDEIAAAAGAARAPWEAAGPSGRVKALAAVADALDARAADLVTVADTETALGVTRLTGEVARTTGQLRMFCDVLADGEYQDVIVSPPGESVPGLSRITHAIGPVAVFAASNFPFAFSVAGGDTASALAAGCPVVVKAHECHPQTSVLTGQIVADALASAGAPAGTFAVVHGVTAGVRLLKHPAITAAGFTGSTRGGIALSRICAERPVPIPFFGELGSVNPVVILPGAAARRPGAIATGHAASLTLGVGQFCTNPGLLFVPDDEGLRGAIAEAVRGSAGGPMLSGRIHDSYQESVANLAGVIHAAEGSAGDMLAAARVTDVFSRTVGRVVWNGWPTGVAVRWAQHHGGPWAATTDSHYTSVGATAIRRWLVPVAYQDFPAELLPEALRDLIGQASRGPA